MNSKSSLGHSMPVVIGVVIAAVSITQENYGGAVFAAVAGAAVSAALYVKSRKQGR
ncbi:hypothetical protein [Streptomyces peucetius]|uniref:Uncharacterized protein n=1 Tax=Streptomyces peucetius TaxID=1950 RepID=A0ABY6IBZ5_STRPE|nr:hypothetical protein [Streptomyces peucetius]UYQ63472.1 hypothetical protein OGH68_19735 [Streptomyces peucetius]